MKKYPKGAFEIQHMINQGKAGRTQGYPFQVRSTTGLFNNDCTNFH